MTEFPQHTDPIQRISTDGRYLTDAEIKHRVKQALKRAYSNTSNPCMTRIESELIKELIKKDNHW